MHLDAYRSCSFAEKREALGVFWRATPAPSPRVLEGAVQYGPAAVLCIVVIALEIGLVAAISLVRHSHWAFAFILAEGLVLLSLWWAIIRVRALSQHLARS